MDSDTHRRIQAEVNCLVCSKLIKLMFPHSANCSECGAVYTNVGRARISSDNQGNIVILQKVLISGKNDVKVEQTIQWRM